MSTLWSWRITRAEAGAVAESRHAFAKALREVGPPSIDVEASVMILGELIANACEHGVIPVEIELRASDARLELEVVDSGRDIRRPSRRDPDSVRGRGFEIIERLGGAIRITPRPRSRVRVTLPV